MTKVLIKNLLFLSLCLGFSKIYANGSSVPIINQNKDNEEISVMKPPQAPPLLSVSMYSGSLKENVERIATLYGWPQLVWDAPDYNWIGQTTIEGINVFSILRQLLTSYPLQAVFYQGNHVLYIHPRTLK